jgi:hypothetical protein
LIAFLTKNYTIADLVLLFSKGQRAKEPKGINP